MYDTLTLGRRIRQLRLDRGLTAQALGERLGRAASQVSIIENGRRDLRLTELETIADILDTTVDDLLRSEAPTPRAQLEIELERVQRGPLFAGLGLAPLPVRKSLSDAAIETILRLHAELERVHTERSATPEEARRANTQLRGDMRARGNYYPEFEESARDLLAGIGHSSGPLSQRATAELAEHLGFTLHYGTDVPGSTRSVTDLTHGRIYLPVPRAGSVDPRTAILQALAAHVLGHREPRDYGDFLRQRVETNYLAGALLIPEQDAVRHLTAAKAAHSLSVEDIRDAFGVGYETAAHRFTNLVTRHLDIPVHFLRVHESGTVVKAYENDGAQLPVDVLGAVEGQTVCRNWSARKVFDAADQFRPYSQYTDKPAGTFWCTSHTQVTDRGRFSVSVGTRFTHAQWFRGRDTTHRFTSACPDPRCCRQAPEQLRERWEEHSFPAARLNSSLLSAMPTGAFPGVDQTEVFEFLDRHATDPD